MANPLSIEHEFPVLGHSKNVRLMIVSYAHGPVALEDAVGFEAPKIRAGLDLDRFL